MSDLVGNPEDRFSHNEAHVIAQGLPRVIANSNVLDLEFLMPNSKVKDNQTSGSGEKYFSLVMRKPDFCICENKDADPCSENKDADQLRGNRELIGAFVFTTRIVQFLFYLNSKFQVSSHLLSLHIPVYVRPGRKPRRPVFSERGSFITRFLPYAGRLGHVAEIIFINLCPPSKGGSTHNLVLIS